MGIAQPVVFALTQGIVPFLFLHQAVQLQKRRRHDSEFLKIENITEGETRETPTQQKLEVLVRVDKTNFAQGERQCSYKLGPGQDTMQSSEGSRRKGAVQALRHNIDRQRRGGGAWGKGSILALNFQSLFHKIRRLNFFYFLEYMLFNFGGGTNGFPKLFFPFQ